MKLRYTYVCRCSITFPQEEIGVFGITMERQGIPSTMPSNRQYKKLSFGLDYVELDSSIAVTHYLRRASLVLFWISNDVSVVTSQVLVLYLGYSSLPKGSQCT